MKKNILIILIITLFCSCKEEGKSDVIKEDLKTSEIKKDEPIKKIETIFDYIDFSNKKRARVVDETLGDIILINKVSLFREESSKKVFIIMELNENLTQERVNNYTIVSRMFPYTVEDLRPESIKKNLEFDSWYLPIKIREVNDKSYAYGQVADDVDGFKKVILQLINKKTKKISPNKIIIENLEAYK